MDGLTRLEDQNSRNLNHSDNNPPLVSPLSLSSPFIFYYTKTTKHTQGLDAAAERTRRDITCSQKKLG